ncbi:hypothetical protein U1289_10805 [Enterococcus cecorum]|uniref:hypothetical protein n=1 Tax=Enterococcus cecorum TaxID=44008 RepID=UPI002ACA3D9C|nr:hypothetical protein [Enterococcus cecorum]MDZ5578602.1 hypothetical protein [Enterococcus cecorum]
MDKALSVYLENKFKLYPKYPSMIARRRLELEYKDEVDESLSTSKSNYGNHEEDKRIKILDDLKINNYYRIYKGVEKTLDELNPEKRKLIEDRYWGEHSWKNWKEYAESINYSVRSAYRLRDEVLAIFAEKIGEF